MTTQTARCPRCGDSFPEGLEAKDFEGICPSCLAFLAVDKDSDLIPSAVAEDPLRLAAKDPPPLKRGATFHGMELLDLIGQGGMGVVYKARQIELGRLVALKILSPRLAADPEFPRRFTREAQALASLDHANIVRIHDVGREGELYFIVMEYVDGMNLRDLLVQKKLAPDQALRIVPQLCEALEYAHSRGVIHRDIKPENILLTRAGIAKIADFGLAKITKDDVVQSSITQTNVVMGTVDYMAPEQRDKSRDADHRADIYSLGVVFYELLTGELPVGRFDPPSRRKPVDARLDDVVLRALEKDPDRRYQRASHMGRDVDRITEGSTPQSAECPILDLRTNRSLGISAGKRLAVHAVACPLVVHGWDKNEIGIDVDGDYQFDAKAATPLLQSQVDTRFITLFVPRGIELDATVDEGKAETVGTVGHLVFKIPDGPLVVSNHEGSLRVHGGTGAVAVVDLKSEYFEIRTRAGSITMSEFALSRGRGQVESESGSVTILPGSGSSFRYHLESRSGSITGPAAGQIGGGVGWLTARTVAGSITLQSVSLWPSGLPHPREFFRSLTPHQLEKLGKYVIVNAGLFLFFIFVAGTAIPAIITAVFWGIALALELWKGYVRGLRPGAASPAMEKLFKFVPTPAPQPPPSPAPAPARTSVLAVFSLLTSLLASAVAAGSVITLLVEGGGVVVGSADLEGLRLGAFISGAVTLVIGLCGLMMGTTASSLVRESRGAAKGRGLAQAAAFLSLMTIAGVIGFVRPRIEAVDQAGQEARKSAERVIHDLRDGRYAAARERFSDLLKGELSEADLKQRFERGLERHPEFWKQLQYRRTQLSGSRASARICWWAGGRTDADLDMVLEGTWRVKDLEPLLKRLGD